MVRVLSVVITLLMPFLCLLRSYAQPSVQNSTFLTAAIENSIVQHSREMRGQSNLYNGSEYQEPRRTGEPHPYFLAEDWLIGDVLYDGDLYMDVPLQYDITRDLVVTELYTNSSPFSLVDSKVSGFSMAGHTFRKLFKDSVNMLPESGYYDILYDGKTKVIARRQKSSQEAIKELRINIDFEERNRYYILKNDRYHAVRGKRAVLTLLKNPQSDLKKFIRTKRLNFRRDRDNALRKLAKFYDTPEQ